MNEAQNNPDIRERINALQAELKRLEKLLDSAKKGASTPPVATARGLVFEDTNTQAIYDDYIARRNEIKKYRKELRVT